MKKVVNQPPKSPEFNAFDCGICNSIEKKIYRACPKSIGELISCVRRSFASNDKDTIDNFFLVQASMSDCLKCDGKNTQQMYNMGKAALRHSGMF